MNDNNEIGGMFLVAAVALGLFWLVPGWIAEAFGWEQELGHAMAWAHAQAPWIRWGAVALYLFSGLIAVVVCCAVVTGIVYVLYLGTRAAAVWLTEVTVLVLGALATVCVKGLTGLLKLIVWSFYFLSQLAWDVVEEPYAHLAALWAERQELRRLYREEYAQDFRSYQEFKRAWTAMDEEPDKEEEKPDKDHSRTDPLAAAARLLGLPEGFTRREFEDRYRRLMKGVHPDVAGPNELAVQINAARMTIKERMGWA